MPAALPFLAAVAAPAGYAVLAYIGTSVAVGIYQADRARKQAHRLQDQYDRAMRTVNVRSAIAPRQLVLGTARVYGVPAYAEFVGTESEYFDQIIAFCNNQVSIDGVYFDDEFVAVADIVSQVPSTGRFSTVFEQREGEELVVSGSNTLTLAFTPSSTGELYIWTGVNEYYQSITFSGVTGNVIEGVGADPGTVVGVAYSRFSNRSSMKVQFATGTTSQASTTWSGVSTPLWTANHRLRGMGYVRTLMAVDDTAYANGLPTVSVLATMASQVWDPRAAGGAGAFVTGSRNPALLGAWYRTLPRADGGMGIPTTWIDWPSVAAAANICDENITVKKLDGSGTESIARYRCDTVLSMARSRNDNLRTILSSMAGDFPFTGGIYKCFAGAYRAPVYTVTDADLAAAGDIEFSPNAGDYANPPNIMAATIFDADKNYNETASPEVVNSGYVTSDGTEEIGEADLPATTDSRRANYLQGVRLEQLRPGHAVKVRLGGVAADSDLFTALQFNLSGHSAMSSYVFELRKWSNNFNGTYDLELVQSKSTTWTLDADRYTPVSATPPPDLSYIWDVARPTGISIASGATYAEVLADGTRVSRLRVTWASHSQAYVRDSGHIEIRWRRAGSNWIIEPPLPGADTEAFLKPITDSALYFVELRATNVAGGKSSWAAPAGHVAAYTGNNEQDAQFVAHGTANAVVLRGRSVVKVAASGAFNAGVYSKAPIRGGCRASFIAAGVYSFVVGLNTDPATDGDYTGIDYAIRIHTTSNLVRMYESGTQQGADGSYAVGDEFAIEYDNTAVRYYQNNTLLRQVAAPPGLTLYFDSSILTVGHKIASIDFRSLSAAPRGNLIDASVWAVGTTGDQGTVGGAFFDEYTTDAENSIVLDIAPDGVLRPLWRCESTDSASGDADGGFITGTVPVDSSKLYRYVGFVKPSGSLTGSAILRATNSVVADIASGTPVAGPNMAAPSRADLVSGRWYMLVGGVLPSGFGTTPPSPSISGVYDVATGQRVAGGTDYKWLAGTNEADHRLRQFNAASGAVQLLCWPRLEMCDGSEPSIDALLAMAKTGLINNPSPDFESQYAMNGQFSKWALGALVPDGWTASGTTTHSRETTITRTGPNAVRSVSAGSDTYIFFTADFNGQPLAEGGFAEGTVDAYLVSHSSGGYPAVRIRCYTNSGLTTFRDVWINLPNTATGGWQTLPFKASVNAGERIYGVRILCAASHSLASGGDGTSTVVWDSVVCRAVQPSDTGQITPGAATNVYVADYAATGGYSSAA